jgi:hypothetical protein
MTEEIQKKGRFFQKPTWMGIAALPPLIFGTGITLSALILQGQHFQIVTWRLVLGLLVFILSTAVIMLGGLLAIRKHLPDWGYSWAGAGLMSVVMAVKLIAEERADEGLAIFNPAMDTALASLLVLSCMLLLFFAALRGWQASGLVSIGFVSILTLSIIAATTAAPFNRYDIALLSAPVGILIAGVTYIYGVKDDLTRIILLVGLSIVNAASVWVVDRVWMSGTSRDSAFWPFFVVVTLALLAGPLAALVLKWFFRVFKKNKHFRSGEI